MQVRSCGGIQRLGLEWNRQADGEGCTRPVWPISRDDRAVHRLDETARDGQPKAGSSADLICLLCAVELVKDMLEISLRDAIAFVDDLDTDFIAITPTLNADRRVRRSILRRCLGG
jgi:hypothetical protein